MKNFSKQFLLSHVNEISQLEERIESHKFRLKELQKEYTVWSQKKGDIIREWSEDKERLYIIKGQPVNTICRDIVHEMKQFGISEGAERHVYRSIDNRFKDISYQHFKSVTNVSDDNRSVEEEIEEEIEAIEDKLDSLPDSRKNKLKENLKKRLANDQKTKEQDVGIHQNEPPEEMQGPSQFSEAVGRTAKWFEDAGERYRKIQTEIEVYKPSEDEERAKDWDIYINDTVIGKILNPFFMSETQAEADRKWTTSVFHWIKIIKTRIVQSKHGAGKLAENVITDPFGHVIYNKKGQPVKRPITRERVGDFERPIVDLAIELIGANTGMMQLHDWLENDQGGHRRFRKDMLSDYFSETSMGSIKSGDRDAYVKFMREYKKKQEEKYAKPLQK